jgi:hypothetical protein
MIATPLATPNCWEVARIPAAAPARSGGTCDRKHQPTARISQRRASGAVCATRLLDSVLNADAPARV